MKKIKISPKTLWITLSLLALGLLGANLIVRGQTVTEGVATEAQASRARQGDLRITVDGSGALIAQDEINLGFTTAGVINILYAQVGDRVQAGDILAQLDANQVELALIEAELAWDQVMSPAAIAGAKQALYQAEVDLELVSKQLLILNAGPYVPTYQTRYDLAVVTYQEAVENIAVVERAEQAVATALEELIWAETYQPPEDDLARTTVNLDVAAARLSDQETLVAILAGDSLPKIKNSAIGPAVIALQNAAISLQLAQDALAKTELIAPIDGTITALSAGENEAIASGASVFTLTTLDQLTLRFYLDESDITWVSVGDPLEVSLLAFPDIILAGSITAINPVLVSVDQTWVVELWADLDMPADLHLVPGMSAEVLVIAAESKDAVLIPLQALIEGVDGSYQVAVLLEDGSIEYRQVTVGLHDFANTEILSGLEAGEKISTAPDLLLETS